MAKHCDSHEDVVIGIITNNLRNITFENDWTSQYFTSSNTDKYIWDNFYTLNEYGISKQNLLN